jgi:5-methylcytosine-specific restriction protein A
MSNAALSVRPLAAREAKLRERVFARDRGVCGLCGVDTEALRVRLEKLRNDSPGSLAKASRYRQALKDLGIRAGQKLWEADHALPLVDGGSDTLKNARTLCAFGPVDDPGCHQLVTSKIAARRARRLRRHKRA